MHNKHRFTRTSLSAILGGSIILVAGTAAAAVCWDFEQAPVGPYEVDDIIPLSDAEIHMKQFQRSDDTWTDQGFAEVVTSNNAQGSSSKEVNLSNINASVVPDVPAASATFLYADLGGNVNLGCNGILRNRDNLSELDGHQFGGCDISVTEYPIIGNQVYGEVTITALPGYDIEKFGIGGQEFYVDDLCLDW